MYTVVILWKILISSALDTKTFLILNENVKVFMLKVSQFVSYLLGSSNSDVSGNSLHNNSPNNLGILAF